MVSIEYANAYSEVIEILKYISKEDYNKIPKEKIELYKENANTNYIFSYDPNKTLNEQHVSKIAKGIIAILFRDYWATEEQRKRIIAKQNYDRTRLEEEKRRKYNLDVFENQSKQIQEKNEFENISTNEVTIAVTKDGFIKKIINKIKSFFSK